MIVLNDKRYLTTVEVAHLHGVHPNSVRNWRADRTDRVRGVRVGGSVLYAEADVLEDIRRNGRRGRQ